MFKRMVLCVFIISTYLTPPEMALATEDLDLIVLGVIASSKDKNGIALIKNKESGKVRAHQEGSHVDKNISVHKVQRKSVVFKVKDAFFKMKVGDYNATRENSRPSSVDSRRLTVENLHGTEGIEKNGNRLRISETVKKALVGENLSKILMQAAAVPAMDERGRLIGFRLMEIDKGSIYDVAGLKNGDIITHINDQPIVSASSAIRALNQLKQAQQARFSFNRGGSPQELIIDAQ